MTIQANMRPLCRLHLLLAIIIVQLVSGCGENRDDRRIATTQQEVVVLSSVPVLLNPEPKIFAPTKPMRVAGDWTWLCAVLEDDVPPEAQSKLDETFAKAVGQSTIQMSVRLTDGRRIQLSGPLQAWEKTGKVLPKGELSYCARDREGAARGEVQSMELAANPPITVKGIYFEATESPAERRGAISTRK
jgi:hypothetical protein